MSTFTSPPSLLEPRSHRSILPLPPPGFLRSDPPTSSSTVTAAATGGQARPEPTYAMTFRLRHRASFPPAAVASVLKLNLPRTEAPPQWHWTWPLSSSSSPASPPPSLSPPPAFAWVSAVRSLAASDDAAFLAFLSHDDGRVALLSAPSPSTPMSPTPLLLHVDDLPAVATSICFLSLSSSPSTPPSTYAAVGYSTGLIAVFNLRTHAPLFVTRPATPLPVRRLRVYPLLQPRRFAPAYPAPTPAAALLAVLGWSATLARLPLSELAPALSTPSPPLVDLRGAGWLLWHLPAQAAVLDAAPCGPDPSSICDLDHTPEQAPLRILSAGVNPPLAAYSATDSPAFSATDVAKRAASTVFSAAKGFLFARIAPDAPAPHPVVSAGEARKAITGVARLSTSWADDAATASGLINLTDVRDSARKSVTAVLSRGRKSVDIDGAAATLDARRTRNSWGSLVAAARRDELAPLGSASDVDFDTKGTLADPLLSRQRSRFAGEELAQAVKLPQNARVVERIAAAPPPCTLLATSDSLGRIFVQDSRDLCVLRVLKGYRDAQVAWLAQGGPLLAILAPRLNVLELHHPLEVKRIASFQLLPGSMLVQSTLHHVFCVSPDGHFYELMRSRKGQSETTTKAADHSASCRGDAVETNVPTVDGLEETEYLKDTTKRNVNEFQNGTGANYETVGAFLEAVKRGQTSTAVECLQKVEHDGKQVGHLMAMLVTCASFIRTEVHVALSSKAAHIASNLKDKDLVSRFEAHGRLAEAFALVFADPMPDDSVAEEGRLSKYGRRLMEDDIGAGLVEFALKEFNMHSSTSSVCGKRTRSPKAEDEVVNCERFILSHGLEPTADVRAEVDYVLRPRRDLSESEQVGLAKLYFSRLLHVDSADFPSEGREHPATKDVFLALTEFVGLSEPELTLQFTKFFLDTALLPLLKTHVSTHASPIRCAIARLRSRFASEVVDQILMEQCETSTRIPNAVLLIRLCAIHERKSSKGDAAPFMASLDRLEEVLLFRKFIIGSSVPKTVYEKFTARGCTGVPGDAERHAVVQLLEWNDFERASKILMSLEESRRRQNLEWHESASVSEAALHACRKKAGSLITEAARKVIPENVVTWIKAVEIVDEETNWELLLSQNREGVLRQIRAVLLNAHQYFPDSSVDAVRCLQLAEAMSALIELEGADKDSKTKMSVVLDDKFKKNMSVIPDENANASLLSDGCKESQPISSTEEKDGNTESNVNPKVPILSQDNEGLDKTPPVPILSEESVNNIGLAAVPTVPKDSADVETAPLVSQERCDMDIDQGHVEQDSNMEASDDDDDDMFFDASSRRASETMTEEDRRDTTMEVETVSD